MNTKLQDTVQRMERATRSLRERRGEDQPRLLFFFFLAAAFSGVIAVIVILAIMASTSTTKAVLDDQQDNDVYSSTVVRSLATITNLQFGDAESASCITTDASAPGAFQRPAVLSMRFRTGNVPDRCDLFVNNVLVSTERRIEPEDCGTSCPFQEFNRQFTIGNLDYRDNHRVRVCCDGICIDKTLERLCG